MTPHECVLAIVGSRDVPRYAAESLIKTAILEHKPNMVVSGGARGVDTFAREIAAEMSVTVIEFVPETPAWEAPPKSAAPMEAPTEFGLRVTVPGGFRARNEAVGDACTCLERLYSRTTSTYGSGWTADHAEKLGKNVTRHLIG